MHYTFANLAEIHFHLSFHFNMFLKVFLSLLTRNEVIHLSVHTLNAQEYYVENINMQVQNYNFHTTRRFLLKYM